MLPEEIHFRRSNEYGRLTSLDLVAAAGFEIADSVAYPMSGTTLERAVRQKLTVSCVVVGRRPA